MMFILWKLSPLKWLQIRLWNCRFKGRNWKDSMEGGVQRRHEYTMSNLDPISRTHEMQQFASRYNPRETNTQNKVEEKFKNVNIDRVF
jgi:hypothetical protein